ncbi:hypothetical protein MSG28_015178 [Choristoneura fumiferana]|uniref:Uncharacterized protein n=1 Tax=Choristoneura fumiferana TaxID=7141 RepID=A0ACC0KZ53_CHOFU|nr:hypothetical protein MSG28_015178 [Choristoneura fumiferana]
MSKVNIPTFKLNSGYQIPVLGYGTFLGFNDKNEFDYSDWDKMLKTLSYCIDVGYRHIDTAHLYRVEPDIGEVVNRKIKEGVVTREEMFITTKVEGVDEKIDYLETWRGFESVLSKGLVRSIGVSNFNVEQLKRLVANCKVKPAVNQVELNLAHGQKELVEYCKTQNIKVTAWAPFGAMIASRALPDAPAPRVDDPTLVAIAKKYGKTVMQNALIFDFELTPSDCSALAKFDVNYRSSRPTFWQNYTNYPFEKYDVPEEAVPECQRKWKDGKTNDKME